MRIEQEDDNRLTLKLFKLRHSGANYTPATHKQSRSCRPREVMMLTFEQVLAGNANLDRVALYWLECRKCGRFRQLANGVILHDCPHCHQPARLSGLRRLRCATSKPV